MKVFFLFFLLLAITVRQSQAQQSSSASLPSVFNAILEGPPHLSKTKLDPSAYVTEKVQRLAKPEIVYVNWNALTEIFSALGITSPPRELTPELTRIILDKIGYAKQVPGESLDSFISEFRDVYSIRYGGRWINYNFGSGRNGATGKVDIKGIGRTALVRPWADGSHSSGIVGLPEAIKEAYWSNILHQELPYGANRVLFVITTGTYVEPSNSSSDRRALIVREDSNRPAYFQQNTGVFSDWMEEDLKNYHIDADQKRMDKLLPRLIENLPMPIGPVGPYTQDQLIRFGFFELIDRVAWQYARAYARQIILAGISTSNVEIDGRAIDYGVTSSVIGFPQARFSDTESPHGTTDSIKSDLFFELAEDLQDVLPKNLKSAIPSHQEISERIDAQFRFRILQSFLELAGTPKDFSEEVLKTPEGLSFSETLLEIARAGNEQIHQWANGSLVGRTGTYNIERILLELTGLDSPGDESAGLRKALSAKKWREKLLKDHRKFSLALAEISIKNGVSLDNLKKYQSLAVPALNRSLYAVRDRHGLWKRVRDVSANQNQDPFAVQKFIDEINEKYTHEFRAGPYRFEIVNAPELIQKGKAQHLIFDLRTGRTEIKIRNLTGYKSSTWGPVSCIKLFAD